MSYVIAQQLLLKTANISMKREETFSKQEIVKKINEIKYLVAQKKVPKISLRKEIIHLENELEKIFSLEEVLIKREKRESAMITALKDQIKKLNHQLAAAEDHDLQRKVDKLSHLLGERLAQRKVSRDVRLSKQIISPRTEQIDVSRVEALQLRLNALKHELGINRYLEGIPEEKVKQLELKISYIEQKLKEYYEKHPETLTQKVKPTNLPTQEGKIKHVMLFPGEQKKEEVKLPPPPQMK